MMNANGKHGMAVIFRDIIRMAMLAFLVSFMANTSEMLRTDGKHNPDVF